MRRRVIEEMFTGEAKTELIEEPGLHYARVATIVGMKPQKVKMICKDYVDRGFVVHQPGHGN